MGVSPGERQDAQYVGVTPGDRLKCAESGCFPGRDNCVRDIPRTNCIIVNVLLDNYCIRPAFVPIRKKTLSTYVNLVCIIGLLLYKTGISANSQEVLSKALGDNKPY